MFSNTLQWIWSQGPGWGIIQRVYNSGQRKQDINRRSDYLTDNTYCKALKKDLQSLFARIGSLSPEWEWVCNIDLADHWSLARTNNSAAQRTIDQSKTEPFLSKILCDRLHKEELYINYPVKSSEQHQTGLTMRKNYTLEDEGFVTFDVNVITPKLLDITFIITGNHGRKHHFHTRLVHGDNQVQAQFKETHDKIFASIQALLHLMEYYTPSEKGHDVFPDQVATAMESYKHSVINNPTLVDGIIKSTKLTLDRCFTAAISKLIDETAAASTRECQYVKSLTTKASKISHARTSHQLVT